MSDRVMDLVVDRQRRILEQRRAMDDELAVIEQAGALEAAQDVELMHWIQETPWHVSPGYVAPDGQQVGPHEYILIHQQPALFDALLNRLKWPDNYRADYNGRRIRYVNLDGYKYWCYRFVCNREKLRQATPELEACYHRVRFPDEPTDARVRRVSARAPVQPWMSFTCKTCEGWHVKHPDAE